MFRILEITWLSIAIVAIFIGAYKISTEGIQEGVYFLVITLVAGIMYGIRRRQRINMDKEKMNKG